MGSTRLTTFRLDGSPRSSTVWFVEHEGAFWVATSHSTWKVRDLNRDDRASLRLREGAEISGRATLEPIDNAPVLAAFATKYGGWNAADASAYGPRVLIRIVRDSVTA